MVLFLAGFSFSATGTHVTGADTFFRQTKNPRLFPDEGFPGVQYELHLIGIDEGHRVSTVIVEHTKRCHQNDAAVQHALYKFFRKTHINQLLGEALIKIS